MLPVQPHADHLFQCFDLFGPAPSTAGLVRQVPGDLLSQLGGEILFGQATRSLVLDDHVAIDGIGGAAEGSLFVFGRSRQPQRLPGSTQGLLDAHAQVFLGACFLGHLTDGLGQVFSGCEIRTHGYLLGVSR